MIFMHLLGVILATLFIDLKRVSMHFRDTDYCTVAECGEAHIACHNKGEFGALCPADALLIDMTQQIPHILSTYNELRNEVAGGKKNGLQPAARMAEMQWCSELSYLAELKAKTCEQKLDNCRSTKHFPYAAQSTAQFNYKGEFAEYNDDDIILKRIAAWFEDIENINTSIIHEYPLNPKTSVGHFTLAVNERNTHVGCAAVRFTSSGYKRFLFVCNFATNNIVGHHVYQTNEVAGSACETSRSWTYPNLCSTKEVYQHDNV